MDTDARIYTIDPKQLENSTLDELIARGDIEQMTIEAVVTRANGTTENHGVISGKHKNWFKNVFMQARIKLNEVRRWHQF